MHCERRDVWSWEKLIQNQIHYRRACICWICFISQINLKWPHRCSVYNCWVLGKPCEPCEQQRQCWGSGRVAFRGDAKYQQWASPWCWWPIWPRPTIAASWPQVKKYLDHEKPFHCSPDDWRDVYYTLYNCEIFVFPLAIIIATHLKIYMLLKRWLTLLS